MLMTNREATELAEPRVGALHNPEAPMPPQFMPILVGSEKLPSKHERESITQE